MYQYPYQEEQSWPDQGSLEPVRNRRRSAPVSVHVLAVLHYLTGAAALAIAGGGAAIAITDTGRDIIYPPDLPAFAATVTGIAVGGVCVIVLGRKLQRGSRLARAAAITLSLLCAGVAGYQSWSAGDPWRLTWLAAPALVLVLCATPAARSWFRRSASTKLSGWPST